MSGQSSSASADTTSPGSGGDLGEVSRTIRATASDIGSQAKQTVASVRDEAVGAGGDLRDEFSGIADAAREKAMGLVDQQKQAGAAQADVLAKAIGRAADELQEKSPQIAQHVRDAASVVSGLADTLRESSIGDIIGEVEGLARRQPVAFFSVAALGGLALSRFLKSSPSSATRSS